MIGKEAVSVFNNFNKVSSMVEYSATGSSGISGRKANHVKYPKADLGETLLLSVSI